MLFVIESDTAVGLDLLVTYLSIEFIKYPVLSSILKRPITLPSLNHCEGPSLNNCSSLVLIFTVARSLRWLLSAPIDLR